MKTKPQVKPNSVEISLVDSLVETEWKNLVIDIGDVALDSIIESDLVKSIPVIGSIAKLCGIGVSVKNMMFAKKCVLFLSEFNSINQDKLKKFVCELDNESGTRAKAGAALALSLERLDDFEKPRILGRLYIAKLEGKISFDQLKRFCMIIDRAHLPDLVHISNLKSGEKVDEISALYLHALGLVTVAGVDMGTIDGIGAETWYEISELGRLFLSAAFPQQKEAK